MVLQQYTRLALGRLSRTFEVLHTLVGTPAVGRELHSGADITVRQDDGDIDPGLADLGDFVRGRQLSRVVEPELLAVGAGDLVLHAGGGEDEGDVVLALQALLDDLHVEETEEATAV